MKKSFHLVVFLLLSISLLQAQPTSKAQVKQIVTNWLQLEVKPLSTSMNSTIAAIESFSDINVSSEVLYYVVSLSPEGYVVVSGDDLVEPIIAFSSGGKYVDSTDNPMSALIKSDIPFRVKYERDLEEQRVQKSSAYASNSYKNIAKDKWDYLSEAEETSTITKEDSISDVYVEPLVLTQWNQKTESGGENCYNLYTPNNYYSGCVATAFAQILRYFEYPNTSVGTTSFDITVDGSATTKNLLGGDGSGGAHNWGLMSYGPAIPDSDSRTAIGRLMNDTGVSVEMSYTSGGSGASTSDIANSLVNTFSYDNAFYGNNYNNDTEEYDNIETTDRENMINTNLDAGLPVALAIRGDSGGHAILSDGYGYNINTQYHHLNMGWGGSQDAWYNLPNIDDDNFGFTSITAIVYNIYTTGTGEIISGRVVDDNGAPLQGASVSAGGYSVTTNDKGIYALVHLSSDTTYTVDVAKDGYIFNSQSIEVGTSTGMVYDGGWSTNVGNRWAVDFTGTIPIVDDEYEENDDRASASDIVGTERTWIDAIQADSDWYKIYADAGTTNLEIQLRFTHADGDIDLSLYDSLGNELEFSAGMDDTELIDYTRTNQSEGAYYYIEVYYANEGNSYELWWDDIGDTKPISPAIINYLLN